MKKGGVRDFSEGADKKKATEIDMRVVFRKFNLIKRLKILAALAQAFPFKRKE